jgi:hypothetical protein
MKESRSGVLVANKTDFGEKKITKHREGDDVLIKESIHQEYIQVLNMYQTTEL